MSWITYKLRTPSTTESKRARNLCSRLSLLAVLIAFLNVPPLQAAVPHYVPGQILVKTRPSLDDAEFEKRLQSHSARSHKKLDQLNLHLINVPENLTDSVLAALRRDHDIEFAERDGVAQAAFVPNDPYIASGSEWHLAKINAPQAWDFTTGSTNIVIAILDSGVNALHSELAGHLLPGYNFVAGTADTSDDFGHGTAVTGTAIAAGNNGIGIAGVAFGCFVLPVKVVDSSGFASYSAVANGIHYAVDHGARVINLSIAGDSASSTLQEAVDYAWSNNVVIVAAAGNTSSSAPQYPAACNHVIGVSATEPDDSLAAFSSYGTLVTLAAPGDNIWTLQADLSNPYGSWRGTSFSSPIVASVAALVASVNPSLTSDQIASLLEQSADDIGQPGADLSFGYGRVNAWSAALAAAAMPGAQITTNSPPPPSQPSPPLANVVLSLQVNGMGHVTPNLNGKTFTVGDVINLRAVPGAGQVFAGWEGLPTAPPNLQLVIQSNLTLTAKFVPSPFAPLKGNYAGLLANTNGVTPADAGYFALTLNNSGTFSGRVLLAGNRYGLHGQFNAAGDAAITLRRPQAGSLMLSLHLAPAANSNEIIGTLTDGLWTSQLLADRNVFDLRTNPAQQAGLRSFLLQQSPSTDPTTAGAGSSRISRSGSTRVRGKLADLRSFSTASMLAPNGDYPFYLSFNHGAEVVIGWLNFPAGQDLSNGTVFWVRSGTNAFAKSLRVDSVP